eukprot:3777849-Prymnesium_polylepis.1
MEAGLQVSRATSDEPAAAPSTLPVTVERAKSCGSLSLQRQRSRQTASENTPTMDPTPNYSKFNPCGWDREDSRRHQLMALIQQPQWDRAI